MDNTPYTPPTSLDPERLKDYINTHAETQYLLIDVRQPAEYQLGHIPGIDIKLFFEGSDVGAGIKTVRFTH